MLTQGQINAGRAVALKASALFAIVGFLWIFLSDRIVTWLAQRNNFSLETVTIIQDTKGFFFVLMCSLLLYLVIHRATGKLESSQQEYRNLFRHNPAPMFIYDPLRGILLAMNEACCSQYGYSYAEMKKLTIHDIRVSKNGICESQFYHPLSRGMKDAGLYRHRKKDGSEIWVHKYTRNVEFGNYNALLVLAFDVTEKVIAQEQLLRQNRRLADLAWFESHKLRAPIARLLGLLHIMDIRDPLHEQNHKVLQHIKETGLELDLLVRQLSIKTISDNENPEAA